MSHGWREIVEPGLYRAHRVGCRSSEDRKPGRRCSCSWQAKVPGATPGTTRTVTFHGSLSDARAEKRRLMAAGRPEREIVIGAGTLDELAAAYFQRRSLSWSTNTLRNRLDDYERRIGPPIGEVQVVGVTRARVEAWLADLIETAKSRRMIVQTVATLRVILGAAVEWGIIADNPAKRLRLPKPSADERPAAERVLGVDDLDRLVSSAGTIRTETMLRAIAEVGMRRGEVAGLRWGDVNLTARRLTIARQIVEEQLPQGGHRKLVTTPKSGRASVVAMSAPFAERLADWYAVSVVEGGALADGYVWPGKDGGPIHGRTLARALERACERAGLGEYVPTRDGKGTRFRAAVSPHRVRHSAASVMLSAGVPLPVVSAQLTHADPAITARIYAHVVGDDLDRAAAVFERPDGAGDGAESARGGDKPHQEGSLTT